VVENVRFALRAAAGGRRAKGERPDADAATDEALERLGLTGRLRRTPVGRLSAGQRRRVALAVVVARRPELWLLDEPHAAFDAGARAVLDEVVREAAADGAAVILASHEPDASSPLADRVVSMVGGRVGSERRVTRVQPAAGDAVADAPGVPPLPAAPPFAPVRGSGGLHVA